MNEFELLTDQGGQRGIARPADCNRRQRGSIIKWASMRRTFRQDLVIFAAALFAWLTFAHSFAWSTADWALPVIVVACIAYSLAMCKFLGVAPLARPFLALTPMIVALYASWATWPTTSPFWVARAILIAQSVALASLGYFLLTVFRMGRGYYLLIVDRIHFRTPDGGTDGMDTNQLFLDFELFRSRLMARRKMKILFPNSDWEGWIRSGFRFTQDEITFAELSPENIRSHDLVVPLRVRELFELDQVRHLLDNNPIPIPSKECIALCDDKYLLNRAMIANGFGQHIPDMDGQFSYPYILKKRSDEFAVNSHIIADAQQEQAYSALLIDPGYFRQEFIPGRTEYTTHILMKDRKVVCAMTIKFVFEEELHTKGRECVANYSKICRSTHLNLFATMLRSINFNGLCCVNYKIVDGRPAIFEINPRFGGSLAPWFFTFVRRVA